MIFLDACYHKPTPRPPIWIMRQAGRYLPEYRAIRANYSFLEMCRKPDVVKEVTLQPIRRFGMDAAIIFSDILLPLTPMGLDLDFKAGEGPRISNPIRTSEDVAALKEFDPARELDYVAEAISLTRSELDDDKALLGFSGAPFTLACYAIAGGSSPGFEQVRKMLYNDPRAMDHLLGKLADMTIEHLRMQVKAGAQAVQIFDTWGGLLSTYDYQRRIFPHVQKILEGLADLEVPRILFIRNAAHFRSFLGMAKCEVIGLDWTMPFEETRRILGDEFAVQGNLDPMFLFADRDVLRRRVLAMIEVNHDKPGYIVNLGHGINKETPIENVSVFVDTVRSYRRSGA